jgi:MerR family mercuric resistance operon transcriptional regulator
MSAVQGKLTIGAFARQAGVSVETIRFYQRKRLLSEPKRPLGGIRRYGETDVSRLHFIKAAQRLGFRLDEIAQLLTLEDGIHCSEAAEFAARHLADVRARLKDLRRMEAVLSRLVAQCGSERGTMACPLIASLHHD